MWTVVRRLNDISSSIIFDFRSERKLPVRYASHNPFIVRQVQSRKRFSSGSHRMNRPPRS